jgi:hypothetical protein
MYHETHGLAIAYMVDSFHRNEWMLWVHRPNENESPDSTWSWRLTELPGNGTRPVTRMKQDYRWETPRLAAFTVCPDGVRRLRHGTPHAQRHQGPGRAREQLKCRVAAEAPAVMLRSQHAWASRRLSRAATHPHRAASHRVWPSRQPTGAVCRSPPEARGLRIARQHALGSVQNPTDRSGPGLSQSLPRPGHHASCQPTYAASSRPAA